MKNILSKTLILSAFLALFVSCSSSDSPAPTPVDTKPTISSFSPQAAEVGSTITITGTNFSTTAANNVVTINGVEATVTAATATQLTVTVPDSSGNGTISVIVGGKSVSSATPFTFKPKQYDVKGYYQGTLGAGNSETGFSIAMIIEENNKMTFVYNNKKLNGTIVARIGYGTYSLSNNVFVSNDIKMNLGQGELVSLNLTFDPSTAKLSGNWVGAASSGKMVANKNITGKDNITGYWKGKDGLLGKNVVMVIENDGTCTLLLSDYVTGNSITTDAAGGTYQLNNGQFTSVLELLFNKFYIKADFNLIEGKLTNGLRALDPQFNTNGTFEMTKMYY
jgi:uncharacterized protein (TIGR03437 family)